MLNSQSFSKPNTPSCSKCLHQCNWWCFSPLQPDCQHLPQTLLTAGEVILDDLQFWIGHIEKQLHSEPVCCHFNDISEDFPKVVDSCKRNIVSVSKLVGIIPYLALICLALQLRWDDSGQELQTQTEHSPWGERSTPCSCQVWPLWTEGPSCLHWAWSGAASLSPQAPGLGRGFVWALCTAAFEVILFFKCFQHTIHWLAESLKRHLFSKVHFKQRQSSSSHSGYIVDPQHWTHCSQGFPQGFWGDGDVPVAEDRSLIDVTLHLQLLFVDPEAHRQSQETLIVDGVDVERALGRRHDGAGGACWYDSRCARAWCFV